MHVCLHFCLKVIMWHAGIDFTVSMCSNEARINNFMKLINLSFYVSKEFPKKYHYNRITFNYVLISRCTHEPFKSVRELGLAPED